MSRLNESDAAVTETTGDYLIRRLTEEGVGHVFGVPGDCVLSFFDQMEKSRQIIIVPDNAGYGTERPLLDGALHDHSPALHRLMAHLSERIHKGKGCGHLAGPGRRGAV